MTIFRGGSTFGTCYACGIRPVRYDGMRCHSCLEKRINEGRRYEFWTWAFVLVVIGLAAWAVVGP